MEAIEKARELYSTFTQSGFPEDARFIVADIVGEYETALTTQRKEILEKYTEFLLESGYVDDDVWCEGHRAVDRFLRHLDNADNKEGQGNG